MEMPDNEIVWPPKVRETLFGYNRIEKLMSPELRATEIIRNVSCVDFYGPILTLFHQLGFRDSGDRQLVEHPYDWRQDLFDLADGLADRLDSVAADEIVLVAHSMGGLVTRLVLESGIYNNRPFFAKITKFIALATPHNGAPLALVRVLGLDGALGIKPEDFKRLSENENYPSGYQLLPAPGEDACWDISSGSQLQPLDYFDPAVANRLDMKPALVARTKALHDSLREGSVPGHIRYFYFSGTGHKTVTRVNVNGGSRQVVSTPDAGDGTVPIWSSLPVVEQKQVVVNEHANVFRGLPFKRVFFRLLGGDAGPPVEALAALEAEAQAQPPLQISLQKPVFNSGEPIEIVIASEELITDIEGKLVFDRLTEDDRVDAKGVDARDLRYQGPGLQYFGMTLDVALQPGIYELHFAGERPVTDRTVFVIAQ